MSLDFWDLIGYYSEHHFLVVFSSLGECACLMSALTFRDGMPPAAPAEGLGFSGCS